MKKIWVIARHDFVSTVRRKGYILMTGGALETLSCQEWSAWLDQE